MLKLFIICIFLLTPELFAQLDPTANSAPAPIESILDSPNPTEQQDYLNLHNQIRIIGFLTFLSLIPFVVVMMTAFTRILIVFHFLRQALSTQQVPSTQLIVGLSLILTAYVMHPVITDIQENALTPYMSNEFAKHPDVRLGLKSQDSIFLERSWQPLREFMLVHTREKDLQLFLEMAHVELPKIQTQDPHLEGVQPGTESAFDLTAIPWFTLVPAFVISELRISFMMGFLLFLPFLLIDMVISSVLMSMGMMMLPPVMISMPFKILLFVIVDGWSLITKQVVAGFFPS